MLVRLATCSVISISSEVCVAQRSPLPKKDIGRFMDGAECFPSLHSSNTTSGMHQLHASKVYDNLCSHISIPLYPKGDVRVSFQARRPGGLANHNV